MNAQVITISAYAVGFIIIYLLCRFFIKPLKWLLSLLFSCVMGTALMLILNALFESSGFYIAINPLTSMMSGVLGIPGIILSYILGMIL